MQNVTKDKIAKIKPIYRKLAAFVLILLALATVGLIYAIITEPFQPLMIIFVIMFALGWYVFGNIYLTGYAPKYLLFGHGPKEE